jgi:hypothetical protein
MMVLADKCEKCNRICNAIYFYQKFLDWTSGNEDIDEFIQDTQLSAHDNAKEALEWISYDRLYNIKNIAKDKIGRVYRTKWIDGSISYWDNENQNWKREDQNTIVKFKNLKNLKNIALGFMNEVNKFIF